MSSEFLDNNLAVIQARWPKLHEKLLKADHQSLAVNTIEETLVIDDIQLSSNINRQAEALLQLARIPEHSDVCFIYGVGLGDIATMAIARESLKNIHVTLLNLAVFLHVLNIKDHTFWLSHEKINLHDITTINDVHQPFCANPADLILASEDSFQLRDRVSLELNNHFIQNLYSEDAADIQTNIRRNLPYIKQDKDISLLPSYLSDIPNEIFIAAAGPTLEEHLTWLKQTKVFIICLDAALATLLAHNITPNIVIAIDKRIFFLFKDVQPIIQKNMPLVYFPQVDHQLLSFWQGPRYCSYSKTKMFAPFPELNKLTPLFSSGSVIHPAIDLAVKLGAKSVILLGADFSFPFNKGHATPDGSHKTEFNVAAANKHWLYSYNKNKNKTMASFKGYLRDLERYINKHPEVNFFSGSEHSAIIEGAELWQQKSH